MNSEEQLIYACHLIGPTLARFNAERPHCVVELAVSLYEMLERVDHTQSHLNYMDPICDLLYPLHILYIQSLKFHTNLTDHVHACARARLCVYETFLTRIKNLVSSQCETQI